MCRNSLSQFDKNLQELETVLQFSQNDFKSLMEFLVAKEFSALTVLSLLKEAEDD